MLFQTYDFFALFIFAFFAVTMIKSMRIKQLVLLVISIVFYAWGSIPHTILFGAVILWTYMSGLAIKSLDARPGAKKIFTTCSAIISFLPLCLYKYMPFLISQFFPAPPAVLAPLTNLALPIGISFYTFQAVGYLIDVYRGQQDAETDIVIYALFLSFFPQLVAGPIERAKDLIVQLKNIKKFVYINAVVGLREMAIGLFMKIFVADAISYIVNFTYDNLYAGFGTANAILLLVSTFFFGIQIYCDFNGYSIIARGVARIMGVDLMVNFERPYFSTSVTEFWRRWHRSLSFWFRDYLFISMGGSRSGKIRTAVNLVITFVVSGIWHGANWTFAIWGGLNGILLVIEKFTGLYKKDKTGRQAIVGWLYTYVFINIAWVFFRANSLQDAVFVLKQIGSSFGSVAGDMAAGKIGLFDVFPKSGLYMWNVALSMVGIALVLLYDIYEHRHGSFAANMQAYPTAVRWGFYVMIMFLALGFGKWGTASQFIYFRF